jgi:hypothetical protein
MKINLTKLSKTLHSDAGALLKRTKLIEKLSKYGKVFISGSYDLGLMVDGDIDLFIISNKIDKKKSVSILKDLIIQNDFNGYLYYDWAKRKHEGFPNGYYLGLKTEYKGRKWKIDVWLIDKIYKPTEKLMNFIKSNLNEKNKKIILELKYKAKANNLNLRSSEIYKKVLKIS